MENTVLMYEIPTIRHFPAPSNTSAATSSQLHKNLYSWALTDDSQLDDEHESKWKLPADDIASIACGDPDGSTRSVGDADGEAICLLALPTGEGCRNINVAGGQLYSRECD